MVPCSVASCSAPCSGRGLGTGDAAVVGSGFAVGCGDGCAVGLETGGVTVALPLSAPVGGLGIGVAIMVPGGTTSGLRTGAISSAPCANAIGAVASVSKVASADAVKSRPGDADGINKALV